MAAVLKSFPRFGHQPDRADLHDLRAWLGFRPEYTFRRFKTWLYEEASRLHDRSMDDQIAPNTVALPKYIIDLMPTFLEVAWPYPTQYRTTHHSV